MTLKLVHIIVGLMATLLGKAGFPLDSPYPHILFNTISPCPSQTGEGTTVKEEE